MLTPIVQKAVELPPAHIGDRLCQIVIFEQLTHVQLINLNVTKLIIKATADLVKNVLATAMRAFPQP